MVKAKSIIAEEETASEDEIVLEENEQCEFSTEWTTTDMYVHWHECECGNKSDIEFHDF